MFSSEFAFLSSYIFCINKTHTRLKMVHVLYLFLWDNLIQRQSQITTVNDTIDGWGVYFISEAPEGAFDRWEVSIKII